MTVQKQQSLCNFHSQNLKAHQQMAKTSLKVLPKITIQGVLLHGLSQWRFVLVGRVWSPRNCALLHQLAMSTMASSSIFF